jgi:acyl-CoA synthetase (AMP-forming)/AMP-acid ligase II
MSTLARHAQDRPDKAAAVIAETGATTTYAELHARSARLAAFLAARLAEGEVVAILLGNRLEYFEACFSARRAGLYYVPVSTHLTSGELEYILRDSGAKMLFAEECFGPLVEALPADMRSALHLLSVDAAPYRELVGGGPVPALPERALGLDFAYSSGTTGRPKGVRHALAGDKQLQDAVLKASWISFFDLGGDSVYLSPAPLYHAAPLRFSIRCVANGGTVVAMQKFDAERALATVERHRVTHSQWVPTMFVRMLGLPQQTREAYDLSSHRMALHAAAPCPVDVKQKIIDWWGPIVWEYYTGSERAGATTISTAEWLEHPGSVGRAAQGRLHIVDAEWRECPPGVEGLVCFEGGPRFRYHNDAGKTAEAHTPQGWATFGDIGRVDADGYLYLTDRRANMIISGGVNIYPQEAENVLLEHPLVHDVAVIGVPNADFGEEVKAVVELKDPQGACDDTATLLIEYCRSRLSHIKCPRSVDFATGLPRTETGKLLKRLIRDQYRAAHARAARPTHRLNPPTP